MEALAEFIAPDKFAYVSHRITGIVQDSFRVDAQRRLSVVVPGEQLQLQVTRAEVKHRANICYSWFKVMRGDLGFSTERVLDLLSAALRSELDGCKWTPPPVNRAWSPK